MIKRSILFLIVLSGCMHPSSYELPEIPCEWHSSITSSTDPDGCFIWWEQLQDPTLNELMSLADEQNLDLQIAGLHVLQARCPTAAEAADDELASIWITVSAEIAENYIELRSYQQRLNLLSTQIAAKEKELELIRELRERGNVNDQAVIEISTDRLSLLGQMPLFQLQILNKIYRLSILLGYAPGELSEYLSCETALPPLPCNLPVGAPSDLLQRRPDIRKAERDLNAASKLNACATQEALYSYQNTVLKALEEAENALSAYTEGQKTLQYLEDSYQLLTHSLAQETLLYQKGVNSYLSVVKTSKQAYLAHDLLIQSQKDQLLRYIAIYKALGGSCSF